jgi:hypothetical protein
LLWVQDAQINLVAPWELTPGQNAQVCCLTLAVVPATPAVFMVDARYAAALNQNGTYNSADNPAAPGSIVTVYATGLGPVTPSQTDGSLIGLPLPANTLTFGVEAVEPFGPSGPEVYLPLRIDPSVHGLKLQPRLLNLPGGSIRIQHRVVFAGG